MKLIDQVKPEVLDALKNDAKINFRASYAIILANLSDVKEYRDLSIKAIDQILLFLPNELHPNGRTDFYFGDYLLKKEYQV